MSLFYEWDCETIRGARHEASEDSEIFDHNCADTYAEVLTYTRPDDRNHNRVVLIRVGNEASEWAYIEDGRLPTHFHNAWGVRGTKVPKRFHTEVARETQGGAA